ncbi:metalloregulator ArsR/SmtB family transcription factor [Labilibaculum sp. K2S]|uniref:ArsR/SmtB family transcription factor n=1 Tax=Labilibaculum sp. K2S TaxID=3056386 RepID=UPI0025A44D4E|nr:metalloregulator ArsR/SmtB family transcription factor [Labilibaculum sp. K2S]MDM8159499.1 metalloregulator ArsR/SmtB family transcription factor [Labilibaculum sp. K2S]
MEVKEFYSTEEKQLARFAKALSHPVRIYICDLLSKQTCCYSGDLAEEVPIARSTLSQHLKELKNAGLIQGEITAPKIKYCLNKENWAMAQKLFKEFFK